MLIKNRGADDNKMLVGKVFVFVLSNQYKQALLVLTCSKIG